MVSLLQTHSVCPHSMFSLTSPQGCINRPARDALLLRHAIEDISAKNRAVELRYELLMSRLIRLHWDRLHLTKVKSEYRKKYGVEVKTDVKEATKAEFGEFCVRLCET